MTKPRQQATILVADDDTTIRTNLRLLLQSEGYRVVEAADGLQADQAFGNPSVALVLLDLKMPGQDGMDLLRKHQDQLEGLVSSVEASLFERLFGDGDLLAECADFHIEVDARFLVDLKFDRWDYHLLKAGGRRGVYDRAGALLREELANFGAHAEPNALEIDGYDLVELIFVVVRRFLLTAGDSGVVERAVELPECFNRRRDHCVDVRGA